MPTRNCLIALLLLVVSCASAQENPALQTAFKTIEAAAMELRQLDALRQPARSFPSREAATEAYVRDALARWSIEDAARSYLLYRALDLAEPGLDLRELALGYLGNLIAGYYDTEDETMHIIMPAGLPDAELSFEQEFTYVHEFVHTLQDQHFDLEQFLASNSIEDNFDSWLTLSALVEGDASLVATEYAFQLFGAGDARVPHEPPVDTMLELFVAMEVEGQDFDLQEFLAITGIEVNPDSWMTLSVLISVLMDVDASQEEKAIAVQLIRQILEADDERVPHGPIGEAYLPPKPPSELPRIILAEIDYMYVQGQEFVRELLAERGWVGVNRAFREAPPQTSEQILHPQRYLNGEGAKEVILPDTSALQPEGWQLAFEGTVGEFYLLQHLETRVNAPHSLRYADGWGGDRMRIYTDETNNHMMWVWHHIWDRANDAEQFAEGYAYFLDKRYFGRFQRERADKQCWTGETTHCFARISDTETRISMAADKPTARALLVPGP